MGLRARFKRAFKKTKDTAVDEASKAAKEEVDDLAKKAKK